MSKESAIKFLRELKTNEKAKDLLQGREKPKSKEDAIKAYAEVAKELGEDISAEDCAAALEEIEIEIHHNAEIVSADIVELNDDDIENVAGGICETAFNGLCLSDYWCLLGPRGKACDSDYD